MFDTFNNVGTREVSSLALREILYGVISQPSNREEGGTLRQVGRECLQSLKANYPILIKTYIDPTTIDWIIHSVELDGDP